jgi:predicted O-linked N-acetylglucosamine transferase (SPINDLY family)
MTATDLAAARAAAEQGRLDAAQALVERALAAAPDDVAALHLAAQLALRGGRIPEAIGRLERAAALAPEAPAVLGDLGVAYRYARRDAEAARLFERAAAMAPGNGLAWHNLGMTRLALGELDRAEPALRRAIAIADQAISHGALGIVLDRSGRLADAVVSFRAAVARAPDAPDALRNLALALDRSGARDEALALLERAAALAPDRAALLLDLGAVASNAGALDRALAGFERALALDPRSAGAWHGIATVRSRRSDDAGARDAFARAVALDPAHGPATRGLANALALAGEAAQAHALLEAFVARAPGDAGVWVDLGSLKRQAGDRRAAAAALERALALDPQDADARVERGLLRSAAGDHAGAEADFRVALLRVPQRAGLHGDLATALYHQKRLDEAAAAAEQAVALDPALAAAFMNLGAIRNAQGRLAEAEAAQRRALALDPTLAAARSNLLLCLAYREDIEPATMLAEHRAWEEHHGRALRAQWTSHDNRRDPDRALTVGFVSADFNRHPVGFFVRGLFERLDARVAAPVCFAVAASASASAAAADDLTAALRAVVPRWVDAAALDDAALAARIRAEGVDILVDLAGHTAGNRLPVFARKPAPVQLTWAGYVGTTGLAAIDWLVADRFHVPPDLASDHVERVLRLPDGYVCYAPPAYAPAVAPLPDTVVFAAFHNPAKVGARAIALWARVLAAVPASRLLLKYKTMDSAANRDRLIAGFAGHGIAADRLAIEGAAPHDRLLARYGDCAIALDSLPYSGGLTTLEALWMGVPVVTLPGRIFASRHSLSHLSNAGYPELVARDEDDYVAIVRALAADRPRLAALRAGMRQRLATSPLLDHARFARGFEAALRHAWQAWCAG